ncbi:rps6 [Symbiodinium natans]|uniref:Rps6 protein n=1 Tax=Symbiodinium natans TaxID=878477 RepID=A0A812NIT8_9DINO|nr:rps6 [Symbiodinium natans]
MDGFNYCFNSQSLNRPILTELVDGSSRDDTWATAELAKGSLQDLFLGAGHEDNRGSIDESNRTDRTTGTTGGQFSLSTLQLQQGVVEAPQRLTPAKVALHQHWNMMRSRLRSASNTGSGQDPATRNRYWAMSGPIFDDVRVAEHAEKAQFIEGVTIVTGRFWDKALPGSASQDVAYVSSSCSVVCRCDWASAVIMPPEAELQEHQEELPGLYQALAKDVISPGLLATRSTLEDVALLTPGSQGISQVATTAGGAQSTGPPSGSHPVAWPGPWYPFVPWSWVAAQSGPTPPGCAATPTPPTPHVQVPAAPCQGQQTATAHPEPAQSPQVVEQPQAIHPTQAQRPPSERALAETAPAPRSSPVPAGQSALAQPAIGSPSANNLAEADAKLQVTIAQEVPAEKASARERREASSPDQQAPAPAPVMVPAIAAVSTAAPAAASVVAAPQPKAANQGPDVVCQGPEASSPQQVLKQVKLLLAGAASGSPPGPSALRAALRSAKTEPWYAETVAQLDGMAASATAELQGMSTTQRVAVALLLLKVHMSSSGAAQAAKLAAAGPTELGPGGDFAWQELLSLLPPWRRAMTKTDFEAFCRISAEHLLPRFKAERVRRLSQVLIELYPPASALEDPQAKASPPSAAQRHPASTSSPLDATSSYRRRQLGAVAAVQRMGDREKDAANVKGAGRGSGSIDLSSLIRRDPAWRVAAKTTDSDSDEIADVNDL